MKLQTKLFGLVAILMLGVVGLGCPSSNNNKCDDVVSPCLVLDQTRCSSDGMAVESCMQNDDGCPEWSATTTCQTGEVCSAAAGTPSCQSQCSNDCNPDNFPACSADGQAVETCAVQADGCYDVVSTGCGTGMSCSAASGTPECVAGCTDQCAAADYPACSGDNMDIVTCVVAEDGCTDMVNTPCGMDMACDATSGTPTCVSTCTDECVEADYPACNGDNSAVVTCVVGGDGCTDMVTTACDAGDACLDDGTTVECVTPCTDECAEADYPACADTTALETCVAGADGCFDIVSTDCGAGEFCNAANDACETITCTDDCVAADFPACSGDSLSILTCTVNPADGCLDPGTTACNAGDSCVDDGAGNVACVTPCSDECDTGTYAPACSLDGLGITSCVDQADGCADIVVTNCDVANGEACEDDGSGPACVACTSDCDPDVDGGVCTSDGLGVEWCVTGANGCSNTVVEPCLTGAACDDMASLLPLCVMPITCDDVIVDGSFELEGAGTDTWDDYSSLAQAGEYPVYDASEANGYNLASDGNYWIWFGGWGAGETAYVAQTINIDATANSADLLFDLQVWPEFEANDVLTVSVDSDVLFTIDGTNVDYYNWYRTVVVDLSAYADGTDHVLTFDGVTVDPVGQYASSFLLDNIKLDVCASTCTDECDAGTYVGTCVDMDTITACEVNNADGCWDIVDVDCAMGEICDDQADPNACVTVTCTDECDGLTYTDACNGDDSGILTCEMQGDGCYDEIDTVCANGGTCDDTSGSPVCVTTAGTCAEPIVVSSFPYNFAGADFTADFNSTEDFGDIGCSTANGASGNSMIFEVTLSEGDVLSMVETGSFDRVLRVLDLCDVVSATCLVAHDDPDGDMVYFLAPADGTYYVVLQGYFAAPASTGYDFTMNIETPICSPGEARCADAVTLETCDDYGLAWNSTTCNTSCDSSLGAPACDATLVINEIVYDNPFTEDVEFIEIFGTPGLALDALTLVHYNGSNGNVLWTAPLAGQVMPSDGYFVVGGSNIPETDLSWLDLGMADELHKLQNDGEAVALYYNYGQGDQAVVDAVGYENLTANMPAEAYETAVAPAIGFGNWNTSIGRAIDGVDTDDNSVDFVVAWFATPGTANLPAEPSGFTRVSSSGNDETIGYPLQIPEDGTPVVISFDPSNLGWAPATIADLQIGLNIEHWYIGDLLVTLTSPDGTVVTLHDTTGGTTDDIVAVYDAISDFDGENFKVTDTPWVLTVVDTYDDGADATLNYVHDFVLWVN